MTNDQHFHSVGEYELAPKNGKTPRTRTTVKRVGTGCETLGEAVLIQLNHHTSTMQAPADATLARTCIEVVGYTILACHCIRSHESTAAGVKVTNGDTTWVDRYITPEWAARVVAWWNAGEENTGTHAELVTA